MTGPARGDRSEHEELEPLARALPTARAERRPRASWVWLVPLAALCTTLWLLSRARAEAGPVIVVRASEGHGLRPGDAVRFRGVDVGEIVTTELAEDLAGVVVRARLARAAAHLARSGTRFWIVRPHVALDEIAGLETLLGARYLEALPGSADGESQTEFVALEVPPVAPELEAGGLEVLLVAESRRGLSAGAPIQYREIQIGSVLSLGLSSDGANVLLRAWIAPAYRQLVRADSRFFVASGVEVELGLKGLELGLDSLSSLLVGSIGLATPDDPGTLAATGQSFLLSPEPDPEWLEWRPALAVGNELLPPDAPAPHPLRATLSWRTEKLFLERERSRSGWVLLLGGELFGPSDLLDPALRPEGKDLALEVGGARLALEAAEVASASGASLFGAPGALGFPWPPERVRRAETPEDCLLVGDPSALPLALSAARLAPSADGWIVDRAYAVDESWHGAPAFARADGRLLGLLLVGEAGARIAPVPEH